MLGQFCNYSYNDNLIKKQTTNINYKPQLDNYINQQKKYTETTIGYRNKNDINLKIQNTTLQKQLQDIKILTNEIIEDNKKINDKINKLTEFYKLIYENIDKAEKEEEMKKETEKLKKIMEIDKDDKKDKEIKQQIKSQNIEQTQNNEQLLKEQKNTIKTNILEVLNNQQNTENINTDEIKTVLDTALQNMKDKNPILYNSYKMIIQED